MAVPIVFAALSNIKEGKDLIHRDYQTLIQLIETELCGLTTS